MAKEGADVPNRWALLVGINYYRHERCLDGAVRDVETVERYLRAGTIHIDIVALAASAPKGGDSCRPPEEEERWPTFANVVAALQRLIRETKPGDWVYIHYSGHGTKTPGAAASLDHNRAEELALVLFENNERGSSYLRGRHLASALHKMVTKGLIVTLVLDCCFSGSVVRKKEWQGCGIRYTDYKPDIDLGTPHGYDEVFFSADDTLRSALMGKKWLLDPEGYTILSACGPHEEAWELEVEREKRGALSYFLLETLSTFGKNGVKISHQSLHEHIRSIFHVSWPKQTPMRYGNSSLSFFGDLVTCPHIPFESVYKKADGSLHLRVGQIHGVCEGDEYAVYPFETPERAEQLEIEPTMMRVGTVGCFESELVENEQTSVATRIETGWKARLVTRLSSRKMGVKVLGSINDKQFWIEAAKGRRFLRILTSEENACIPDFHIALRSGAFEVLDALQEEIVNLPKIQVNDNEAIRAVMEIVEHLATFKYFEGIENRQPSPNFEASFSILPQRDTEASGEFIVRHGDIWGFTAQNWSDQPLYVSIFNFNSSWGVSNLVSDSGGDSYDVLPPRTDDDNGTLNIELQMEVPPLFLESGFKRCEDVVKVFVTNKPTSFPSMVLPEIPLEASKLGQRIGAADDPVSLFLSELDTKIQWHHRYGEESQWASRNFIIRTLVE